MKYTVESGDTLAEIAKRYNVSVDDLLDLNRHITNRNKIYAGDTITVPALGKIGGWFRGLFR